MPNIGIVLFDGVEELDFVGPLEVFQSSRMLLQQKDVSSSAPKGCEPIDYPVITIGPSTLVPVRCSKGLRVLPDFSYNDHPPLGILLVPGGQGTRKVVHDEDFIRWLHTVARNANWCLSVCTGIFLLHEAGIAVDKHVATHWAFEEQLENRGNVTVVREKRWVVDGNLVSSQGISAGLDMALWIVGQWHNPQHSKDTQRYMQYDPCPPYRHSA